MAHARGRQEAVDPAVTQAVLKGLTQQRKQLPAWLFYDAAGSELFEAITELPEYYPTRTERDLFAHKADALVAATLDGHSGTFVELGAGSATKTQLLLEAAVRQQGRCVFVPVDVSPTPLEEARVRMQRELPGVEVRPMVGDNAHAARVLGSIEGRRVVLFIGSSIGNYEDAEAVTLLSRLRAVLAPGDALVLSTDLRKPLDVLLPAYDDAAGVTAAFNRNVLVRLNRELGADFDVLRFAHRARWNEERSRVEMHLESQGAQEVHLSAIDLTVHFRDGETLHTESSHKYDAHSVERLLAQSGFALEARFLDPREWYAVNLARVR